MVVGDRGGVGLFWDRPSRGGTSKTNPSEFEDCAPVRHRVHIFSVQKKATGVNSRHVVLLAKKTFPLLSRARQTPPLFGLLSLRAPPSESLRAKLRLKKIVRGRSARARAHGAAPRAFVVPVATTAVVVVAVGGAKPRQVRGPRPASADDPRPRRRARTIARALAPRPFPRLFGGCVARTLAHPVPAPAPYPPSVPRRAEPRARPGPGAAAASSAFPVDSSASAPPRSTAPHT